MLHTFLVVLFVFSGLAAIAQPAAKKSEYELMRDSLLNLTVDASSHRLVEGLLFEDGLISISLDSGSVAFMERYDGRLVAAVFRGRGTVAFTPNYVTEVINLKRFTGQEQLSEEFDRAVFVFTDNRFAELINETRASGAPPANLLSMKKDVQELLARNDNREVDARVARCLLNGTTAPGFFARTWLKNDVEVIVGHDPFQYEPYTLAARRAKGGPSNLTFINQCPDVHGWPELPDSGVEPGDLVSVSHHKLTCAIDRSLDLSAEDVLTMEVLEDGVRWINLSLTPYLTATAANVNGAPAVLFTAKDSYSAWVQLPSTAKKGDRLSVAISFSGSIIDRVQDYTILRTSIDWLPVYSHSQKSLYEITFSYPSSMTLLSLGKQDTLYTVDRTTTSRWTTSIPNTNNSFHIGLFKKREIDTDPESPTATMYYRTVDQVDAVAMDVKQSLLFFTRLFGNLSIKHLNATELPGTHGEAFPGLLHLSSYAFFRAADVSTDDFFGEQFTSHEVAHQWWGISVKPLTYRDRWLSEGFAEYSCLLYSQLAAQEQKKFNRLLLDYRDQIMKYGKRTIGTDLAPPPVHLGHRVRSGAGSAGDPYNAFVYYKGAWVLHMLRNMMIDLKTMNEDVFITVMKEFFTTYNGKRASTEDFRAVIQKVTGSDVSWFFNQWIYGNEQPTYRVAWKKDEIPGGQWRVTLRVRQENVSEDFRMIVPIKIEGKDGRFVRMRLNITGNESVIELPHVAFEPKEVTFNDLNSVLCLVKTEGF